MTSRLATVTPPDRPDLRSADHGGTAAASATVEPEPSRVETSSGRSSRTARSRLARVTATAIVTWILLLLVAAGGALIIHQRSSTSTLRSEAAQVDNTEVIQLMTTSQSGIRGYQLTRLDAVLDPYRQAQQPLADAMDRLDRYAVNRPDLTARLNEQRQLAQVWLVQYAEPQTRGEEAAATPSRLAGSRAAFDAFRAANEAVQRQLTAETAAAEQQQRLGAELGLAVLVVLAIGGAIGLVRPAFRAVRQIGPPLADLEQTVARLRGGDLSARADTSGATGELRQVAVALNEFAASTIASNDRLAEEVRLSQLVVDLGHRMTTLLDLDEVAGETVRWLATHFDSIAFVRAFDTDRLREGRGRAAYPLAVDGSVPPGLVELARRVNETSWQRRTTILITQDRPSVPTLLTADEGLQALDYVAPLGVTALLFVPIGAGQQALGYLTLARTADQPLWTEVERKATLEIGCEVGRAVLLARLFARDHDLIAKVTALEARRNDFVAMASHAIRTPLTSIVGYLEMIRGGDLGTPDPELEPALAGIDRNSARLVQLADDCLLLAQLEDGTRRHRPEAVDLQAVCRSAVESQADRARVGQQSVLLTVHGRVAATGVPAELSRAIESLLGNAIKFSHVGGTVRISVRSDPGAEVSVIEIHDVGIGIPGTDQQQLFTRFFRGNRAISAEIPGMGLGLRIAKLVIDKHHGSISVTSSLEQGTTVRVELPRAEPVQRPVVVGLADEAPEELLDDAVRTPEQQLADQLAAGVQRPAGVRA